MPQWELGIQFHCLLCVFLGDGSEVLTQEHARGEQITSGRIGRDGKHLCESLACAWVVLGLHVADAENISGIDICAGIPRLDLFKRRYGLRGPPSEVQTWYPSAN